MLCEARLHQTYMAGVPHLRVLPEPWASDDKRAPEIINLPARGGTAVTSALATAYMAAAAAPNAKDLSSGDDRFKSCCLLPLFQSNDLDEHVSRTPLHVTLGLGTNYLKAVEARCAELDSVWAINVTDQVLTDEWLTAVTDVEMAKEAVAECERNLRSKEAGMAIILEKDAEGSDPRAGYLFQRSSVPPRSPLHYKLTTSRSHLTLDKDSGRTKMNGKKSRMAVLFSTTRGVSCRRENKSRFLHLKMFHSQQLSLEKVHNAEPNGDEERRGGDVWFLAWV
jgi:hypothetical protein